jgi:hypothetical protein
MLIPRISVIALASTCWPWWVSPGRRAMKNIDLGLPKASLHAMLYKFIKFISSSTKKHIYDYDKVFTIPTKGFLT